MASNPAPLTLSAADFQILRSVPIEWFDEEVTVRGISEAQARTFAVVRASLTRFVALGLVERRTRQTISPTREIRRIAKDEAA